MDEALLLMVLLRLLSPNPHNLLFIDIQMDSYCLLIDFRTIADYLGKELKITVASQAYFSVSSLLDKESALHHKHFFCRRIKFI